MSTTLASSAEYQSFRTSVPLKRIIVDGDDSKVWSLFDAGPRDIKCPVICLPPAAGKADVFYRQILGLSGMGCRAIALDYPVYWNTEDFCVGLRKVIDHLRLDQVHIFGCSLGGYLALKFAERVRNTSLVASMVVCNGFTDTAVFKYTLSSSAFWLVPAFILKRLVMGSLNAAVSDVLQAEATDFVVECLENLSQQELSSRLVLHCNGDYVRFPHCLQHIPVTIIDVFDESALSQSVKDDMYKCFPDSKRAHLKSGGNFPYLSRPADVNLHLRIHLKQFDGTNLTACKPAQAPDGNEQSYQPQTLVGVSMDSLTENSVDQASSSKCVLQASHEYENGTAPTIKRDDNSDVGDFPI